MSITRVLSAASVAAVLAAALAGCSSSVAPIPPGLAAHPATMTIDGKPYVRVGVGIQIDSASASSVESEQLKLTYEVQTPVPGSTARNSECDLPVNPFAYVVRQDATRVVVAIGGYQRPSKARSNALVLCADQPSGWSTLSLRLAAPLGRRSIRDATTKPMSAVRLKVGQPR